jgi:hypothetical protein
MKINLFIVFLFLYLKADAQNNKLIIGHWQLNRVAIKYAEHEALATDKDELKTLFKTVLLQKLVKDEPVIFTELEDINKQAKELASLNTESVLEIQSGGAIYNRAQKSLSGEYLVKKDELIVQWSNAEENNFKIVKLNANELVLKDMEFNLVYYYNKLEQEAIGKEIVKLKKAKELVCIKPDSEREVAEKVAKEKLNKKQ